MRLTQAIGEYESANKAKHLSPQTMRWYAGKLARFAQFCRAEGIGELGDITNSTVRAFAFHLSETPGYDMHRGNGTPTRSDQTVRGYMQVVKGFLTWAGKEDLISERIAKRIDLPRVESKLIRTLTPGMYRALVTAASCEYQTWLTLRDRAILAVLMDTGIRADELCRLTTADTDLRDGSLLVRGKGNKWREVGPLGKESIQAMQRYTRVRNQRVTLSTSTRAAEFLSRFGGPLTVNGLDEMLYRLERWAGVDEFEGVRVSAHTFRHTYAVRFLEMGGDVYRLSKLLGHTSVTVTERYLRDYQARVARKGASVLDAM